MIVNSWTRSEYYRIKAALHGKVPTRMELFRMMKEPQYLSCIEKSKENIFRQYLDALEEMGELSAEDEELKMSRLQRTSRRGSPVFMLKLLQAQPFYPCFGGGCLVSASYQSLSGLPAPRSQSRR